MNNQPAAQHVFAEELPLPEVPSVIGGKSLDNGVKMDGRRIKSSSRDLPLQYSIEEEDGGSSQASSQMATLARDADCQLNNSEC